MDRFVFVRSSWMRRYAGDADDEMINGGSYIETELGGERYNFKVVNGKVYARFQPQLESGGFNLPKIVKGSEQKNRLNSTTVVFVATRPEGGQRVVGWYRDAFVYASEQPPGKLQRADCWWNIKASAKNAVLLPANAREWEVPTTKGGMSTTHVRYPLSDNGKPDVWPWMTKILKRIAKYSGPNALGSETEDGLVLDAVAEALGKSGRQGFMADPVARRAVEDLAMRRAINHFGGDDVVSDDHIGNPYDLSVLENGKRKYIEVKGTTGTGNEVLLTAGEVNWARKKPTALFVLQKIKLKKVGDTWKASGGTATIVDPWSPDDNDLRPMTYLYRIPEK